MPVPTNTTQTGFPDFSAPGSVDRLLEQLNVQEKVTLLGAGDYWHTAAIPRLGIPQIRTSDGPNGVRGQQYFAGVPASCIPSAAALASTFDVDFVRELGDFLGRECRDKGVHVLLAPTVNIPRVPIGGRCFESFSEDPILSGEMATAYIQGVQGQKVAAAIKHLVCNDQEYQRHSISSEVDERTLREVYLRPFEIAIAKADPKLLMTGYNAMNGRHCSESKELIQGIVRAQWGYKGLVISDWYGTYSVSGSMNAGLDLEFPAPVDMRGAALMRAMKAGKVTTKTLNERVRKVLELIKYASESGIPANKPEVSYETLESRALLRKAAAMSHVLLKNSTDLLPLSKDKLRGKKVAIIGQNASQGAFSGGGSAILVPYRAVSPVEGLTDALGGNDTELVFAQGCQTFKYLPALNPVFTSPDGTPGKYRVSFYAENFELNPKAAPVLALEEQQAEMSFAGMGDHMDEFPSPFWAKLEATVDISEAQSSEWEFGLCVAGTAKLHMDGEVIVDNTVNQTPGTIFYGFGTVEESTRINLEAGIHRLVISFASDVGGIGGLGGHGGIRIGGRRIVDEDEMIEEASMVAKDADVAVVVVGLNEEFEGEGFDRPDLNIPGRANDLIAAVAASNPNTIVVLQGGCPLGMPWINEVSSVLMGWYTGNEGGHGLADVLLGEVNPSARLAVTFPVVLEDVYAKQLGEESYPGVDGKVHYKEKTMVGYKGVVSGLQKEPLFAFGHGLSYTTFEYSGLSAPAAIGEDGSLTAKVQVKNTGSVTGSEVVQVYVRDIACSVERPAYELRAFSKTPSLAPGESQTVEVTLDRVAWAFYDVARSKWVAEAGEFEVVVAKSSAAIQDGLAMMVGLVEELVWDP